jgi:putative lipoprotein
MRLKNRYVAVLAVLTLFIAGCSNNLVGRMSGDGNAEGTVTLSVTNIPSNYADMIHQAQNPASRSILPNAPFAPNDASLTFMLTGTSNGGNSLPATQVNLDATHKFNIVLSAQVWDLTLTAYKNYNASDSHHKPVLVGHCTVDLTNNNGTATFAMSTKGLTTPGTAKVTGSVLDPLNICTKYTISICDAYSGKPITQYKDLSGTSQPTNAEQEHTTGSHSGSFNFHYGDTTASPADPVVTLNPGAYTFLMIFHKGAGTSSDPHIPIGSYADTIVVDPGNDLVQTLGPLDVLNKAPTDPQNLRAYLENNSEDTEGAYYHAKLIWDSSMFEINYELELSTYPDDGSGSPTTTIYGFNTTNTAATNFAGSLLRYSGSLISGSNECTLKLELGKVYEVKLRARNYIGESNWIERVSTPAATPPSGCELIDTGVLKHINRRRIRYNLNGGTLTLDKGGTPQTKTGNYIVYDSYQGVAKNLLKIEPSSSATGNTLSRGTVDFVHWLNPNTAAIVSYDHTAPVTPSDAVFYKHANVDVTADFGNGLEGTVTTPGPITDIAANKIKITYDKNGGTSPQTPTMNGTHYKIPKRIGTDVSFIKVEFDNLTPSNEYTNMECTAYFTSGAGVSAVRFTSAPDGNSCTFSTGTYPTQTFVLKVSAYNTSHTLLSRTFLIDLHN